MTAVARIRHWPFALVVLTAVAGLFVVAVLDRFRRGSVVFAAAFALAGVLRLTLPARTAGLLAVRGRIFDVFAYAVLAAAIAVLALSVPGDVPGG